MCILCLHVHMCVPVFPHSCIHGWMPVYMVVYIDAPAYSCVHMCVCVCALGGSGQSGFCIMCPSGTSFPRWWTLPVSPLPPWHCLCLIRIPKAPAVDHEPFPVLHSHHRAEGNFCVVNLYLGWVSGSGDSRSNVNMTLGCWGSSLHLRSRCPL